MSDEYNGWANHETWALNLHLSNDHGLYLTTLERAATAVSGPMPHYIDEDDAQDVARWRARAAGDAIKDFWEELVEPDEQLLSSETIIMMLSDVGSVYRVDWDEIGAAWLPENQ